MLTKLPGRCDPDVNTHAACIMHVGLLLYIIFLPRLVCSETRFPFSLLSLPPLLLFQQTSAFSSNTGNSSKATSAVLVSRDTHTIESHSRHTRACYPFCIRHFKCPSIVKKQNTIILPAKTKTTTAPCITRTTSR